MSLLCSNADQQEQADSNRCDCSCPCVALLRGILWYYTDGAARGRSIKLKVKLKEPSRMLEAQQEQQTDSQQDVRIPGGQKKKRRRQ